MKKDLQLSPHFKLSEFERSDTATRLGIDNTCPAQFIPTLQQLCQTILEPLRAFVNSPQGRQKGPNGATTLGDIPIIISSGYRCNQLNAKIGGAYASQHTLGEAADIHIPKTAYTDWDDNQAHTDMAIAECWFLWLQTHTDYDQLILETSNDRDYWIHVSCRAHAHKNRHEVFRYMKKK